jgi:hypothetical protein
MVVRLMWMVKRNMWTVLHIREIHTDIWLGKQGKEIAWKTIHSLLHF